MATATAAAATADCARTLGGYPQRCRENAGLSAPRQANPARLLICGGFRQSTMPTL